MWQSGEKSHQHWWDEFTSIPLPFFFQIQSQSLLLCTWHISWYLHSCWKPIAHPRVQENAQNIVNVLFLKYCSLSLNHLFLVMALWGSSIFVTVGLGHISNTQPAWSVCVSPDSFTFHRVEIASEEFICQLHPGEGKMCLQESQWASTWALLGGVRWSHTSTWQMMLLCPWRMAPNGGCIKVLAGCWLPIPASPAPEWDGWLACPCLSCHGLCARTAVFIFPQCMCLILCWPCKREGPGCVAKFSWWGCTCHWANSTYHC